jgi:hypothetical protein
LEGIRGRGFKEIASVKDPNPNICGRHDIV